MKPYQYHSIMGFLMLIVSNTTQFKSTVILFSALAIINLIEALIFMFIELHKNDNP